MVLPALAWIIRSGALSSERWPVLVVIVLDARREPTHRIISPPPRSVALKIICRGKRSIKQLLDLLKKEGPPAGKGSDGVMCV
jgi:hypothetical protein